MILDPQTETLYTANEVENSVSVIAASRCDARTTRGCRPRVPEVPIPAGGLAADPAVGTASVASTATAVAMIETRESDTTGNPFTGHSVYVINGHAGDATNTSGCDRTPPTVDVGPNAIGDTNQVYATNIEDTSAPRSTGTAATAPTPAGARTRERKLSSATTRARSASIPSSARRTLKSGRGCDTGARID